MKELEEYINQKFGITEQEFLNIMRISPGAEGYILGNLGEQLFKELAEKKGYEVKRIKEKPEGGNNAKEDDARGDFYIRKKGGNYKNEYDGWLVVECKNVKSNSEKRSGLTKKASVINLIKKHSIDRKDHIESIYRKGYNEYIKRYNELQEKNITIPEFRWNTENPGPGIPDLSEIFTTYQEIENWVNKFDGTDFSEDAYWDLKAPIRQIQTHMPSTRIDELGLKSTGPLVTEFNILCLDLFLRTGKHEFVFANSQQLNAQAKSPNHLQQNYTIDILVEKDGFKRHKLLYPWYDDLEKCINETKPKTRVLDPSQLDTRIKDNEKILKPYEIDIDNEDSIAAEP